MEAYNLNSESNLLSEQVEALFNETKSNKKHCFVIIVTFIANVCSEKE